MLSYPLAHYCSLQAVQYKARRLISTFFIMGSLMFFLYWLEKIKSFLKLNLLGRIYYGCYKRCKVPNFSFNFNSNIDLLHHGSDQSSVWISLIYVIKPRQQACAPILTTTIISFSPFCASLLSFTWNNHWPYEPTIPLCTVIMALVFCCKL